MRSASSVQIFVWVGEPQFVEDAIQTDVVDEAVAGTSEQVRKDDAGRPAVPPLERADRGEVDEEGTGYEDRVLLAAPKLELEPGHQVLDLVLKQPRG